MQDIFPKKVFFYISPLYFSGKSCIMIEKTCIVGHGRIADPQTVTAIPLPRAGPFGFAQGQSEVPMSKKLNEQFFKEYLLLEKECRKKFDVETGGIRKYIDRFDSFRFLPEREEVESALCRYSELYYKFANHPDALQKNDDLKASDIRWVRDFAARVRTQSDPISLYLKKAERYFRRRKLKRIFISALAVLLVLSAAAVAVYFSYFYPA